MRKTIYRWNIDIVQAIIVITHKCVSISPNRSAGGSKAANNNKNVAKSAEPRENMFAYNIVALHLDALYSNTNQPSIFRALFLCI